MTGTVVGTMGSVFFAMYFDAIRLAKDNYRATMTAILLTLTLIRGVGYFAVGEFSRDVWSSPRSCFRRCWSASSSATASTTA